MLGEENSSEFAEGQVRNSSGEDPKTAKRHSGPATDHDGANRSVPAEGTGTEDHSHSGGRQNVSRGSTTEKAQNASAERGAESVGPRDEGVPVREEGAHALHT